MAVPKPDYLSRDYTGLRQSLLDYARQAFPEWQPSSEGDFGMVLVELFAYTGDILSYYTDRAQMENYLTTATQRESVLGLAYLLGYVPTSGAPATGTVTLVNGGTTDLTVPAGAKITTPRIETIDGPVTFEVDADTALAGGAQVVVPVTEGTTVSTVKIGESSGQPSQSFLLPNTGAYSETVRIYVEDATGSTDINGLTAREWVRKEHLLDADGGDPVFETFFNDSSTVIGFGDDINGAIPATGLQIFASYRHGFGASGNVSAGQVRFINDRSLGGVRVATDGTGAYISSAMTGGADPESTESIRYNAPRAYRTQNRAVTEEDFRDIALGVEGVSKANVVVGTFTSVTVYVAGPDGGTPSESLKKVVADRYLGKTLGGVTVTVASPTFVPVNVGSGASPVAVEVRPGFSQRTAKAAIEREVKAYIQSLSFGQKLSVGALYDVIMNVEGVRYVDIPVMARNDVAQTGVVTITPRVWEIFTAGTITLALTGGTA